MIVLVNLYFTNLSTIHIKMVLLFVCMCFLSKFGGVNVTVVIRAQLHCNHDGVKLTVDRRQF